MNIKQIREKYNLSQTKLAKKSNLAQSTIHYIETGQKSPTVATLKKISAALGIPINELIEGAEKQNDNL